MSNEAVVNVGEPVPATAGLSQIERVVDTFVAPTKTFKDILRSASWWLPFVLILVTSIGFVVSVDRQVGFDRVYDNILRDSPKAQDQLNQLTPEARAQRVAIAVKFTKGISYASPVVILIVIGIYSLILWAAFNFGLGATTSYPQVFAVVMYAGLPGMLLAILTILTVSFGSNVDAFNINNPVGTNLAYYMPDASLWLKALLGRLDILKLWTLALETLGMAVIAKKSITQSALIVGGFWLLVTVVSVGYAAMQS
jgi:hypothetical protein